jgi:hypothetical protein
MFCFPCSECTNITQNTLTCMVCHRFGYISPQWARISSGGVADDACVSPTELCVNSRWHLHQCHYLCQAIWLQANNKILWYIDSIAKQKTEKTCSQLSLVTLLWFSTHSPLQLFIITSAIMLHVQNHYKSNEYVVWNMSLILISALNCTVMATTQQIWPQIMWGKLLNYSRLLLISSFLQ